MAPPVPARWATARIDAVTADLRHAAEADETARRLQTMPGIGPITASVLAARLPDVSAFRSAVARGRSDPWRNHGRPGGCSTSGRRAEGTPLA